MEYIQRQTHNRPTKLADYRMTKACSVLLIIAIVLCVPYASASPQASSTRNIIIVVKPKQDFTTSATISLIYDNTMELVAASPGNRMYYDDITISSTASSRVINAEYDRTGTKFIAPQTQMLVLRFNTSLSASEAFNAVRVMGTASTTTIFGTYTGDEAFTYTRILAGDIDNDGEANAADALLALQHSTHQITLTESQQLAADVNHDGLIDASDSLLINQYSVQIINTFWPEYSPVTLPTTANSNIRSGMVYRLENTFGKKGLNTTTNASVGAYVNQANYDYSKAGQRYKLVYMSSGAYKIIPMNAQSRVLSISGGRLCVESDSSLARQRWYIVPSGEGNLIINKAYPSQCLTLDGLVSAGKPVRSGVSTFGNKWTLHGITEHVDHYYDNGMLKRWNLTPTQMSTQINQYMQTASDLYRDAFGITLVFNSSASRYTTSADNCTGTASLSALNKDCTNASHDPRCKDNRSMWSTFKQTYPGDANRISILWTGHHTWEIQNGSRVEITDGGMCSYDHSIMMLNIGSTKQNELNSNDTFYYKDRIAHTVCHELGHEFGASDSYCRDINGSGANCPANCYNHGGYGIYQKNCLMANQNNAFSTYTSSNMFCNQCKSDIIQHINTYH